MKAMLDSGSQLNLISKKALQAAGLQQVLKKDPYSTRVANGKTMPGQHMVLKETKPSLMEIQGHTEMITLDVLEMAHHDVILGLTWLRKHNVNMKFGTNQLSFEGCDCTTTWSKPTQRQRSLVDGKPTDRQSPMMDEKNPTSTEKTHQKHKVVSATERIKDKDPVDATEQVQLSRIPKEYHRWLHLFTDIVDASALLEH